MFQVSLNLRPSNFKKSKKVKAASKKEIHSMTNLCIQNLDEINFFKPKEKKPIMLEKPEKHFLPNGAIF
jgi:tRNA C32,U32 (ribose-2'-O)-methylase TrmJ